MPALMKMQHDVDPKTVLLDKLGNIDGVTLYNDQILVAIYDRPEVTRGGIHIPGTVRSEEEYQGKAGLIIKTGPGAFNDPDGRWFVGADIKVGDWIAMRPSDGWGISVNGVKCRMLNDTAVRAKIDSPDRIW